MDNSRNVLEVQAETSISGRFSSLNPIQERDRLLTQLLFASRDLARRQFTRPRGSSEFICTECRFKQYDDSRLNHHELGSTGRVLRTHSHREAASLGVQVKLTACPLLAGIQ